MQSGHALNLYDSLHTMSGMKSSKSFSLDAPHGVSPRPVSARTTRQQSAIDSIQIPRCQQQSQQQ